MIYRYHPPPAPPVQKIGDPGRTLHPGRAPEEGNARVSAVAGSTPSWLASPSSSCLPRPVRDQYPAQLFKTSADYRANGSLSCPKTGTGTSSPTSSGERVDFPPRNLVNSIQISLGVVLIASRQPRPLQL
ncbi:hypothetical protein LV779_15890 [Streptomyces thinghirensis]|nr:hypothetical protein [Streptomyces thinghirensis]